MVSIIYKVFEENVDMKHEINEKTLMKYKLEEIDPSEEVVVDTLPVKQSS